MVPDIKLDELTETDFAPGVRGDSVAMSELFNSTGAFKLIDLRILDIGQRKQLMS
jgi:hypothetical protein